jgi:formamidopyrimidine-DNA glycosylase
VETGTMIIHLGMSGRLCVVRSIMPPGPHDRFDLYLTGGFCLRLTDPKMCYRQPRHLLLLRLPAVKHQHSWLLLWP